MQFRMCMTDISAQSLHKNAWSCTPLHHIASLSTRTSLPILLLYLHIYKCPFLLKTGWIKKAEQCPYIRYLLKYFCMPIRAFSSWIQNLLSHMKNYSMCIFISLQLSILQVTWINPETQNLIHTLSPIINMNTVYMCRKFVAAKIYTH